MAGIIEKIGGFFHGSDPNTVIEQINAYEKDKEVWGSWTEDQVVRMTELIRQLRALKQTGMRVVLSVMDVLGIASLLVLGGRDNPLLLRDVMRLLNASGDSAPTIHVDPEQLGSLITPPVLSTVEPPAISTLEALVNDPTKVVPTVVTPSPTATPIPLPTETPTPAQTIESVELASEGILLPDAQVVVVNTEGEIQYSREQRPFNIWDVVGTGLSTENPTVVTGRVIYETPISIGETVVPVIDVNGQKLALPLRVHRGKVSYGLSLLSYSSSLGKLYWNDNLYPVRMDGNYNILVTTLRSDEQPTLDSILGETYPVPATNFSNILDPWINGTEVVGLAGGQLYVRIFDGQLQILAPDTWYNVGDNNIVTSVRGPAEIVPRVIIKSPSVGGSSSLMPSTRKPIASGHRYFDPYGGRRMGKYKSLMDERSRVNA